jgi:uncharacterized repeat protein (TIGR03803 family)
MLKHAAVNANSLQTYRSARSLLRAPADVKCLLKTGGALMGVLALCALFGGAQTLHSFAGGTDGANPFGGVAVGQNGALYGTTFTGGVTPTCPVGQAGTVFQMLPPTSPGDSWTETVIYAFTASDHCFAYPLATPTVGPNGALYGTTYFGGPNFVGDVYELTPPSSPGGVWTETTLYAFSSAVGDPQNPVAGVVLGKNGVLYGTVQYAGTSQNCSIIENGYYGCGAVYSLTPPASLGGAWTEQTLYTFQGGTDGAVPLAGLTIGKNGELYGTTYAGGTGSACTAHNIAGPYFFVQSPGCGTVFELEPPSSAGGAWTETVLYNFTGGSDGGFPNAVVYQDGVLDGTVTFGGNQKNCGGVGCGDVFQLSPSVEPGGAWNESVIYSFTSVPDGLFPGAGVAVGRDGTIYGTTRDGGDASACSQNPGCGIVYQLKPPQFWDPQWREEVLHRFTATDGWRPTAGVAIGNDGNLYGTTYFGGTVATCSCGVVFRVSTEQ